LLSDAREAAHAGRLFSFSAPDDIDGVLGEFTIGCKDCHRFEHGLRDDEPVKGITMVAGEVVHFQRVEVSY
jgi:hypothetical protein